MQHQSHLMSHLWKQRSTLPLQQSRNSMTYFVTMMNIEQHDEKDDLQRNYLTKRNNNQKDFNIVFLIRPLPFYVSHPSSGQLEDKRSVTHSAATDTDITRFYIIKVHWRFLLQHIRTFLISIWNFLVIQSGKKLQTQTHLGWPVAK